MVRDYKEIPVLLLTGYLGSGKTTLLKILGGFLEPTEGQVIFDGDVVTKFHPLKPLKADFIDWFIDKYDIKLCELYYEPYNFVRTGCVLCPYNQKLRDDMIKVKKLLPTEYKKAEIIWGKVYDEYRRVGYRLNKNPYTK